MAKKSATKPGKNLESVLPWLLLIGSLIAMFAAGVLMVDKIELAQNPNKQLACDLNPIIACGSVIATPQASAFGFPNPMIGLVGFGITATIGAAMLAGATFKRWFWQATQVGVLFGVLFITWLQYQTIFNIGALCPYCMVVWTMMIPMFWYTTLYIFRQKYIVPPKQLTGVVAFAQKHHADILMVWFLIIIGVILNHFWYYWSTVI